MATPDAGLWALFNLRVCRAKMRGAVGWSALVPVISGVFDGSDRNTDRESDD
jgi:hypothetical protein